MGDEAVPRRSLRSRVSVPWVVAIVGGLLTGLLFLTWMRQQDQVVSVIAAASEIRTGTIIDEGELDLVDIPAGGEFGDALLTSESLDALVGRVATRTVAAGEPVLRSDSREVASASGDRAMSLPIAPEYAVGGDIVPGDSVDVVVVDDAGTVRYVAVAVAVLAVPPLDGGGLTGGGSSEWFVTLAVDANQVLEIAQSLDTGTVHLIRSTGTGPVDLLELPLVDAEAETAADEGAEGAGS